MRPPLAGKRAAARRLAEQVRRRLPVFDGGGERVQAVPAQAAAAAPTPEDAAARIDAARARLRASIEAPVEPDDPDA